MMVIFCTMKCMNTNTLSHKHFTSQESEGFSIEIHGVYPAVISACVKVWWFGYGYFSREPSRR